MIIKHIESLDDRGTIAIIQENPYMQYFLGLEEFGSSSHLGKIHVIEY